MREILFKGKTKAIAGSPYNNGKSDGEWVKGYLYNDVGCWKIRQFETDYADYISYEVDPETVGQYTGLTDKNGTKIFEGDIVKTSQWNGFIEWCDFDASFVVHCVGTFVTLNTLAGHAMLEVIGNIHDNPELMKNEK